MNTFGSDNYESVSEQHNPGNNSSIRLLIMSSLVTLSNEYESICCLNMMIKRCFGDCCHLRFGIKDLTVSSVKLLVMIMTCWCFLVTTQYDESLYKE